MKRKWLSVVALVLALCMLPMSAFAVEEDHGELSFAVSRASSCITKSEYVSKQGVILSKPIPQYESTTGNQIANAYLMFDGDAHIGLVLVSSKDENRSATAYLCNYPVLEMAKNAGSRVVFYQENGCFTVYIDGERFVLANPNGVADFVELEIIESGCIISIAAPVSLQQNRSIYYSLNVDFIGNGKKNGLGICWAAAMASKINYQRNFELTAEEVYDACWETTNYSSTSYPRGNSEWYKKAAEIYNISLTELQGPISNRSRMITCFRNGLPIIMRLQTADGAYKHAVVNCGIEEDAEWYELKIMDPNETRFYRYITIPNSFFDTQEGFSCNLDGYKYTVWYGTFY